MSQNTNGRYEKRTSNGSVITSNFKINSFTLKDQSKQSKSSSKRKPYDKEAAEFEENGMHPNIIRTVSFQDNADHFKGKNLNATSPVM